MNTSEKKSVGRPRKNTKADHKISAYLSEDEYNHLLEIVEAEGRSVSQHIKWLITQDLQKKGLL